MPAPETALLATKAVGKVEVATSVQQATANGMLHIQGVSIAATHDDTVKQDWPCDSVAYYNDCCYRYSPQRSHGRHHL